MLLPRLAVNQLPANQSFPPQKKKGGSRDVGVVVDVALSGFNQGKFEGNPTSEDQVAICLHLCFLNQRRACSDAGFKNLNCCSVNAIAYVVRKFS